MRKGGRKDWRKEGEERRERGRMGGLSRKIGEGGKGEEIVERE